MNSQQQQQQKEVEFIQEPDNSKVLQLDSNSPPLLVQCTVKNAFNTFIECNNKLKEEHQLKRIKSIHGTINYETISTIISRNEIDYELNRQIKCHCIALSFLNKKKVYSTAITIKNTYLEDQFPSEPLDQIAFLGDNIEMRCDPPRGDPMPIVYWLKNGVPIEITSRFRISNDFSLLILMAKMEDEGDYTCVAEQSKQLKTIRKSKPAKLILIEKEKETTKYEWSNWTDWTLCNDKCEQKRFRFCRSNTNENNNKKMCIGNDIMVQECSNCDYNYIENDDYEYDYQVITKNSTSNHNHNHNNIANELSKSTLISVTSGLLSGLLFILIILFLIFVFVKYKKVQIRRKQIKKDELNLYYTCENVDVKPHHHIPLDENENKKMNLLMNQSKDSAIKMSSTLSSSSDYQTNHFLLFSNNNSYNMNNQTTTTTTPVKLILDDNNNYTTTRLLSLQPIVIPSQFDLNYSSFIGNNNNNNNNKNHEIYYTVKN
jgi:hypothetical protein